MMFPAQLRIGSLEILGALALFGVLCARSSFEPAQPRPPARPARLNLTVFEPPSRGGKRELNLEIEPGQPAVIGRSSTADVELCDPEVSRSHAALTLVDGVLYLRDAGSSNGTFLNGKPVDGAGIEVLAGDSVDVGTTRITVNHRSDIET